MKNNNPADIVLKLQEALECWNNAQNAFPSERNNAIRGAIRKGNKALKLIPALLEQIREGEWQPIKTIPQKSGLYLVKSKQKTAPFRDTYLVSWFDGKSFSCKSIVTHWLPIKPPTT